MAKVRPYYADGGLSAAYYDAITASDASLAGDIEFYAGLLPPAAAVLELGAGSGRVTMALAQRGFSVIGVDLSPAMLRQAQALREAQPAEIAERIELRRGDMTALDLKRAFDLVICPFFTLAHVPAGAAWKNTFATVAHHLAGGGLAAFHLPRLDVMRGLGPADPRRPVFEHRLPDGARLLLFVTERRFRDPPGKLEQVIDYVLVDASGKTVQRSPERLTYWMADPGPFAAAAGLSLDRPPVAVGEAGDIWVFRKP